MGFVAVASGVVFRSVVYRWRKLVDQFPKNICSNIIRPVRSQLPDRRWAEPLPSSSSMWFDVIKRGRVLADVEHFTETASYIL